MTPPIHRLPLYAYLDNVCRILSLPNRAFAQLLEDTFFNLSGELRNFSEAFLTLLPFPLGKIRGLGRKELAIKRPAAQAFLLCGQFLPSRL